jgi:phosphoribosyl 1,2-cyclic phosphodiesterase
MPGGVREEERGQHMRIKFWGVRGSIASPGPDTAGVGGNTSCVEVRCGETRLVLDAGTGVRRLGDALLAEGGPVDATILLSHLHWDHIQGLPLFAPAYLPSTRLQIVGGGGGAVSLGAVLAGQMTAPVFPVRLDELGADLQLREVRGGDSFAVGDARVRAVRGNHPGGVLAYRIDHAGRSVVYATDIEHYACVDPSLRALAEGADVLIYDSQYTPEEYRGEGCRSRVGWGHSTYVAGAELARAAGVGRYVLFHHDPQRSDAAVIELERRAVEIFPSSVAAREGMEIGVAALAQAA